MFKIFKNDAAKKVEDKKDIISETEKSLELSRKKDFYKDIADIIYENYDIFIPYLNVVDQFLYRIKYKLGDNEIFIWKNKCELGEIEENIKSLFGKSCIDNFTQFFMEISYLIEKNNSSKHILSKVFEKEIISDLLYEKLDIESMKIILEKIEEARLIEFDSYNKWYDEVEDEKTRIKEMLVKIYEIDDSISMEGILKRILYKIKYDNACGLSLKEYITFPYDKHNPFEHIRYWILQIYLACILASLVHILKYKKSLLANEELTQILKNILEEANAKNISFTEDCDFMDKFYLMYKKLYPSTFDKKLNRQELYILASAVGFMEKRVSVSDFNAYEEIMDEFIPEADFDKLICDIDSGEFIKYKNINIGESIYKDIHYNKEVFEQLFDYLYLENNRFINDDEKVLILMKRHIYVDKLMNNYLIKNLLLEKERLLNTK